jgi:CRISPR-associated protein Cas1
METLFISREAKLKRKENTLFVTVNGRTTPFPIEKVRHLVLLADSSLTTKLLCLCGQHGVRLSIFDYYGYCKGTFEPVAQNPAGRVKLAQAALVLDNEKRQAIARELVRGTAHNMRSLLAYYQYRGNTAVKPMLKSMDALTTKIAATQDSATLMGIEGNLHQHYYSAWQHIDKRLDFGKRVRRPPNNPINCLLSFLNQLVYTVARHEAFKTHLDESFSFLHSANQSRSSLSLDLAEPFKPILSHALIFRLVRKNIMQDNWFEQQDGVCLLNDTGRKHIVEHFATRLEEQRAGCSYRSWLYQEALNIERHILGVAEYQAFRIKL